MTDINALLLECRRFVLERAWAGCSSEKEATACLEKLNAFLAAEMVAVPREPTEEMTQKGMEAAASNRIEIHSALVTNLMVNAAYRAMIAAAEEE